MTEPGGAAPHASMVSVVTNRRTAAVGDAEKSVESVDRSVGHLRSDRGAPIKSEGWVKYMVRSFDMSE